MSQGKAWNKDEVIRTLEPFFKLGCNVKKACSYAGIPYTTVMTWIDAEEELRIKVEAWQNEPNNLARKNWIDKMKTGDYNASQEWLTKKEKDEFSERKELGGIEGKDLLPERVEQNKELLEAAAEILRRKKTDAPPEIQ